MYHLVVTRVQSAIENYFQAKLSGGKPLECLSASGGSIAGGPRSWFGVTYATRALIRDITSFLFGIRSFRSDCQRLAFAQRFFPVTAVGLESLASDGCDGFVGHPEGSKCSGTPRAECF